MVFNEIIEEKYNNFRLYVAFCATAFHNLYLTIFNKAIV